MKQPLLLLVALAAVGPASAALIYSGVRDHPIPTTFQGMYLDLISGDVIPGEDIDFTSSQVNFFFGGDGIASGPQFLPVRAANSNTAMTVNLPLGTVIDATSVTGPETFGGSSDHIGPGPSQFPGSGDGYLGFRLDADENGTYTNGWMRVSLTNGSAEGVVHEWVYSDTPGEPVTVGVIPEPAALLLLASGSLVLALRRRRG